MAQEVNLLDPLGIAKAVRGQVNQMAIQAKLPPLPEMPAGEYGWSTSLKPIQPGA